MGVWVFVRERERERERKYVCKRDTERVCVRGCMYNVYERERRRMEE